MNYNLKNDITVELREVKLSDASLLIDFFKIVNLETKNLLREPEEFKMTINDERKFLRRVMNSNDEFIAVVVYDEEIIGTIGIRSRNLKRITHRVSLGMSVRKDFNNLGLGTVMMKYIMDKAKEMGKLKMELDVRKDNIYAIRLYERFGFELEGTIKKGFYVDDKYIDLLFMGKWL